MALNTGCDCGCCAGLDKETPQRIYNRPNLPAITYRAGRYHQFRESFLSRMSAADLPALRRLTTRDDADFTIALCDATAVVLEVLGFYQERLANESFLRTARDRASVLELARLIGYQLSPGVAASAWLAFTVQESPGLPGQPAIVTTVPSGTGVQSVPGPDEQPQTFETTAAIEARAEWNAMPVQTAIVWVPQRYDRDLYLAGVSTGLAVGDAVLIVGQERLADPGSERWDVRVVATVEPDVDANHTRITWLDGLGSRMPSMLPAQDSPRVHALRQRASLFGHNASDPRMLRTDGTTHIGDITDGVTWKNYVISSSRIDLDAAYPKVVADSWVALVSNRSVAGSAALPGYTELYRARAVSIRSRTDFGMSGKITRITPDSQEHLDSTTFTIPETLVLAQSEELLSAPRPLRFPLFGASLTLGSLGPPEAGHYAGQGLTPGQPLAVSGKRQRIVIADGVRTLAILLPGGRHVPLSPRDSLQLMARPLRRAGTTTVTMTPEEFGTAVGAAPPLRLTVRDRDGAVGLLDCSGSHVRIQAAFETDEFVSEVVIVADGDTAIEHGRDGTRLLLTDALTHVYDRPTVRVNANVAPATHGETVRETLGGSSGDADQRFTLRQSPVTFVSAATASGRAPTLELRVNDLQWVEVRSLYGRGTNERVFTTAVDDSGHLTVIFGDGVEGARPPRGADNIRTRYRKGIGTPANVRAGQLANLLTRPFGINGVANPEPANGGQDAEDTDRARANAPLTVRTLDRAVSVQDYEDFARSFAGIAKAHAAWIPVGPGRGVLVTVAGEDGAAITSSDATFTNLLDALRRYGDSLMSLRLATFRAATFRLRVAVKVDPGFEIERVLDTCAETLRRTFSFAERQFGQQVSVDEIAEVLHRVPGVIAVNVIELYRPDAGGPPRVEPRLFARLPESFLAALPEPAELLTLEPGPIRVEVMA
jgi:hypothetical protein